VSLSLQFGILFIGDAQNLLIHIFIVLTQTNSRKPDVVGRFGHPVGQPWIAMYAALMFNWTGSDSFLLQQVHYFEVVMLAGPILDVFIQLIVVAPPLQSVGKFFVSCPIQIAQGAAKAVPLFIGTDGDVDPSVLPTAAVAALDGAIQVSVACPFGDPLIHGVVHDRCLSFR